MAPTARSFSADFEPLRLVARFPECYPGLLESAAATCTGDARFDILPISCGETLVLSADGNLQGPYCTAAGFLKALEQWWSALKLPHTETSVPLNPAPPFTGGWLLYLGYELASEIEPRLKLPPSPDPVTALAIRAPAAWIRDRIARRSWLFAESGYESLLDRFEGHVKSLGDTVPCARVHLQIQEEESGQFLDAVRRSLDYIAAGEVYQTNLSRQWRGSSQQDIDTVAIYRQLRTSNPSPFAAILRHGDFALLSSSPERLLSIRRGFISTRPIAGTRPRGKSPQEDLQLVKTLLENEKERAEHVMLIDLERNDLGRVCVAGSVRVDEFMSVETFAHVHHIVSNVVGWLRKDVSPIEAIRALFPGGTITGCPKIRCMEIIAELEASGRGAYTGSIGYLNRDGDCDLNILIRTISVGLRTFAFRAGAGIVADSSPLQELAETRAKAEGLMRALAGVI